MFLFVLTTAMFEPTSDTNTLDTKNLTPVE